MRGPLSFARRSLAAPMLLLAGAVPLAAYGRQVLQMPSPGTGQAPAGGLNNHNQNQNQPPEPLSAQTSSKLEHMREDERRKRLVADTAKLLALSSELKDEVDKSSRDELSLSVIRKAAEIEKLARDVRERMKN